MIKLDTYFLVKALRKGNLSALEELYKVYYSKLYAFAKKFDQASLEPDDFVQQTFMKVWENREQLKEDVLFDKQIFIICRNIIFNQLKRDEKIRIVSDIRDFPSETAEEPRQEEEKRNITKLYTVIEKLPRKRKEIFILHKIENLSYEEIAGFHDISKKTIANHIYLATLFIRDELKKL